VEEDWEAQHRRALGHKGEELASVLINTGKFYKRSFAQSDEEEKAVGI